MTEEQDKRPYFTGQAKWHDGYWEASVRLYSPGVRSFYERIVEAAYFNGMDAKASAIAWVDSYGERLQDAIAVFGEVGTIDDYVTDKVYVDD